MMIKLGFMIALLLGAYCPFSETYADEALPAECLVDVAALDSRLKVDAVADSNTLAGTNPIRTFGDTKETDQWATFSFKFTPVSALKTAKIVMKVKPIGGEIGTDMLILRGDDSEGHKLFDKFNALPRDKFTTCVIDLSVNPSVINAIKQGVLEGVIQDDTAVESVQLVLN